MALPSIVFNPEIRLLVQSPPTPPPPNPCLDPVFPSLVPLRSRNTLPFGSRSGGGICPPPPNTFLYSPSLPSVPIRPARLFQPLCFFPLSHAPVVTPSVFFLPPCYYTGEPSIKARPPISHFFFFKKYLIPLLSSP